MSTFKFEKNPVSGLQEAALTVKLVSDPEKSTIRQNSNKKNYKVVSVEFENAQGKTCRVPANIYEGNYSKGITKGEKYLSKVTIATDGKAYIQMSHLTGGEVPTLEMFGLASTQVSAKELQEA